MSSSSSSIKFPKVLFILKKRDQCWGDYGNYSYGGFSSGLFNSATFVKDMLLKNGIMAKLVEVIDNSNIDKEVFDYKPTHVILEGFWVVPNKLNDLIPLHPNVKWIIRNHSDISFLSTEGVGIQWAKAYTDYKNTYLSCNKLSTNNDFKFLAIESSKYHNKIVYLPNYYPDVKTNKIFIDSPIINISCFGAIRSLKNPVIQAIAAMKFAQKLGKILNFHINGGRTENQGEPVLKSLVSLFENTPHKLINHPWLPHNKFLQLIKTMDICMQVSFDETFNICAGDAVSQNIPVVVSKEIFWVNPLFHADCTSSEDILQKLSLAWNLRKFLNLFNLNKVGLNRYSKNSEKIWIKFLYSTLN